MISKEKINAVIFFCVVQPASTYSGAAEPGSRVCGRSNAARLPALHPPRVSSGTSHSGQGAAARYTGTTYLFNSVADGGAALNPRFFLFQICLSWIRLRKN